MKVKYKEIIKNKRLTDFEETKEAVINNYIREDLRELKTKDKVKQLHLGAKNCN